MTPEVEDSRTTTIIVLEGRDTSGLCATDIFLVNVVTDHFEWEDFNLTGFFLIIGVSAFAVIGLAGMIIHKRLSNSAPQSYQEHLMASLRAAQPQSESVIVQSSEVAAQVSSTSSSFFQASPEQGAAQTSEKALTEEPETPAYAVPAAYDVAM